MTVKNTLEFKGERTSLLSWTTDMAAWSWSLPAVSSCPGMDRTEKDTICASCYACIGNYLRPNVLRAQTIRFTWAKECMRTAKGRSEFVRTMGSVIREHVKNGYFRIHDSGDFFSPIYADCWRRVANTLPSIRFWAPTRSYGRPDRMALTSAKWEASMRKLSQADNVTIRPSAIRFDSPSPILEGFAHGSAVLTSTDNLQGNASKLCPKTLKKDGSCENCSCRSCWDNPKQSVAYLVHGVAGQKRPCNVTTDKITATRNRTIKLVQLTLAN